MSLPFIIKLLFIPQTHNKKAISNQPYRNEQQDSFEIAFSLIIFPRHAKLFDSGLTFSTLVRILHISFLFCSKKFTISKSSITFFSISFFSFLVKERIQFHHSAQINTFFWFFFELKIQSEKEASPTKYRNLFFFNDTIKYF